MIDEPAIRSVQWRDWGEAAFDSSRIESKPVLLALTATWCHWCHVMDQTSYADTRVIDLINNGFIPVRVDVDQRPDLSARYNQGGFPSLALLNSEGAIIEGRIYTPPGDMVQLLEQVGSSYPHGSAVAPKDDLGYDRAPKIQQGATVRSVIEKLEEIYDPSFGGFGGEPKQPPWDGIDLLLSVYHRNGERRLRDMACRTLDGISDGLFDHKDRGFFRYSVSRDWKVPHYEKMLVTNARSVSSFLMAFQVTGKTTYKNAAKGALDYLVTTLSDPVTGFYLASQDAGEDYYRLPWKDRDSAAKPAIDATLYAGWNALAASTLVHAFGVLGVKSYLESATHVLETVWAEFQGQGPGLPHVLGETLDQARVDARFLADHVHAMGAYLDLYQATGDRIQLQRAVAVFDVVSRLFGDSEGGFYDVNQIDSSMPGIKPVLENALLAANLVTVAAMTGEDGYLETARTTLDAFDRVVPGQSYLGPPGAQRMEEDEERLFLPAASAWARARSMVDSGAVRLAVVGEFDDRITKRLVKEALKARTRGWVVQILDPAVDADMVDMFGFPVGGPPKAYLCVGMQCLPPFHSPADMRRATRPGALADLAVSFDVA